MKLLHQSFEIKQDYDFLPNLTIRALEYAGFTLVKYKDGFYSGYKNGEFYYDMYISGSGMSGTTTNPGPIEFTLTVERVKVDCLACDQYIGDISKDYCEACQEEIDEKEMVLQSFVDTLSIETDGFTRIEFTIDDYTWVSSPVKSKLEVLNWALEAAIRNKK
jgi:hypothetical protein